jgi:hypothetical protein
MVGRLGSIGGFLASWGVHRALTMPRASAKRVRAGAMMPRQRAIRVQQRAMTPRRGALILRVETQTAQRRPVPHRIRLSLVASARRRGLRWTGWEFRGAPAPARGTQRAGRCGLVMGGAEKGPALVSGPLVKRVGIAGLSGGGGLRRCRQSRAARERPEPEQLLRGAPSRPGCRHSRTSVRGFESSCQRARRPARGYCR